MSPLVRPLLALATAAMLASAHAEDNLLRERLLESEGLQGKPAACSDLAMGAMPDSNQFIKMHELPRFHVDPMKNPKKFEVHMPIIAKKNEAPVGQNVVVCDFNNPKNNVDVKQHKPNQHGPLTVTCSQGCPNGVEVIADQWVIHKLS